MNIQKKKAIFIFCYLFILVIFAQEGGIINTIEREYKAMTLKSDSIILDLEALDNNEIRAAKFYYQAVLTSEMEVSKNLHSLNFTTYRTEFYGQLSGIQLISLDFVNKEYDEALRKTEQINSDRLPEVLYWKAKINQLKQDYDTAISISENFIRKHNDNHLVNQVWLIIFESNFYQRDTSAFEKNYQTFSKQSGFIDYNPYLLYLNGMLYEGLDNTKARGLYTQIVSDFPTSQFRVQAEDRLFGLRSPSANQNSNLPPPIIPSPPPPVSVVQPTFRNSVVSRYEDLSMGEYYIQFGALEDEYRALNLVNLLKDENIDSFHITKPVSGRTWYAVIQGPYASHDFAVEAQNKLRSRRNQSFIFEVK